MSESIIHCLTAEKAAAITIISNVAQIEFIVDEHCAEFLSSALCDYILVQPL